LVIKQQRREFSVPCDAEAKQTNLTLPNNDGVEVSETRPCRHPEVARRKALSLEGPRTYPDRILEARLAYARSRLRDDLDAVELASDFNVDAGAAVSVAFSQLDFQAHDAGCAPQ
jgi:hypothetical protein